MRKFRFLFGMLTVFSFSSSAQQIEVISGAITQNTTWSNDKTYLLSGYVYVKNNASLTIQPGTIIQGEKESKGTLIVSRGAKIIADGKRNQPIVFTSNAANPAPGDWGGVVICGYAPTNAKTNNTPCLGVAEGGINTPEGDALFGSGDQTGGCGHENDNSGILRFVRIEYGGIAFQFNNETNGLTLAGVGSGTTIDYVECAWSGDDAFEFFGGTVNCKHLVAYGSKDDDFDCDLGYQGHIQFALAVRDPSVSDVSGSNGLEIDNDNSGTPALPKTRPVFSNLTITGPTLPMGENYRRAAHLRRNSEPAIYNSVFIGTFPVGLFIDGISTIANAQNNLLEVKNTYFADAAELLKTNEASFNIGQWFGNGNWANAAMPTSAPLALTAPFNFGDPNAQPLPGSMLNAGASFTAARANIPFFEKTTYIGAFSQVEDWSCGWAKFEALNTNCTVSNNEPTTALESLKIAPVPADQYFTVTANLTASVAVTIDLFNYNGQFLQRVTQEKKAAGSQSWTVTCGDLPEGFYLVRIQAGNTIQTEKIVIMRK